MNIIEMLDSYSGKFKSNNNSFQQACSLCGSLISDSFEKKQDIYDKLSLDDIKGDDVMMFSISKDIVVVLRDDDSAPSIIDKLISYSSKYDDNIFFKEIPGLTKYQYIKMCIVENELPVLRFYYNDMQVEEYYGNALA